jgi:two-component system, NarL family, sensor histidine kinase DegS
MKRILPVKSANELLRNPHFWAITVITLLLIFIYQAWPWRVWQFDDGIWRYFFWLAPLHKLAFFELLNRVCGVLFLVPIIYAAIVFSWRGALVTFLLSLVVVLPIIANVWSLIYIITNLLILVLPLLVILLVSFEFAWRLKERKIFAEREAERQIYTSKIIESQENERKRIAQELHDDTIPALLVIANRAQTMVSLDDNGMKEVKESSEWIRDATLQTVEDVRRISLDLRPSILDDLGLIPALRWLVDRTNKESAVNARITFKGAKRKLSPQAESDIFRCVQEALNNIKHHSQAKEAVVTLEFTEDNLLIMIQDNGRGFIPPRRYKKLVSAGKYGLVGMQGRINNLNGTLKIRSRPGEGTSLFIEAKC